MPKIKETWERFKGSILVVLGAIGALIAVVTATDMDDKLCARWDACKAAYDQGQAGNAATPSPSMVE